MSLYGFHAALKVTKNPYWHNDPSALVRVLNLALDDPDNFEPDSRLSEINIRHSLIEDSQLVETVGRFSTRNRRVRGLGVRMAWDIDIKLRYGNPVNPAMIRSTDLQKLIADLGSYGMTGHQDGVSRYLWFSPNYRWNNPAEQWVLVTPMPGKKLDFTDGKPWGSQLKMQLVTDRNYQEITWLEFQRGNEGVLSGGTLTPFSVGTFTLFNAGGAFLTEFIYGDDVLLADGTYVGTVLSVQSDTQLTLVAGAAVGTLIPEPYLFLQRSAPSFLVPVYTFVEMAPSQGWGLTPWGENWGSPSP